MGQGASTTSSNGGHGGGGVVPSDDVQALIQYARDNYLENPTESLAALLRATALNSNGGQESLEYQAIMDRVRNELGEDIANHIGSTNDRQEKAMAILQGLLEDSTTELHNQGRQDILRQTMEDGSSVVCSRCNDVVASTR